MAEKVQWTPTYHNKHWKATHNGFLLCIYGSFQDPQKWRWTIYENHLTVCTGVERSLNKARQMAIRKSKGRRPAFGTPDTDGPDERPDITSTRG